MRHRELVTIAALAVTAVLASACSTFEVAPDEAGDAHGGAHDDEADTPPIDGAEEVAISATSMAFTPGDLKLTAGEPANLALTSEDVLHDLTVDEVDFHVAADEGETVVGGIVFDDPGTYVAYCSVAGHRQAGMELEIAVS